MNFICPVCGFPSLSERPRSLKTGAGSDEICPSCGFQFGFDDDDRGMSYKEWRKKWMDGGMKWASISTKPPEGWNPVEQIKNIDLQA